MPVQSLARGAREGVAEFAREAGVVVGGVATTLAVVLANNWLLQATGWNLLSFSFWFIIPVGAVIGGVAAATGYYGTARATQTMPSKRLAWEMTAIAVSVWALRHWLAYLGATFADGQRARDLVDFATFVPSACRSSTSR